jgi:hypothetical protein
VPAGRTCVLTFNPSLHGTGGGVLFTWGGDFSWAEPCDVRAAVEAAAASENGVHVDGPLGAGALGTGQNGTGPGVNASAGGKVPAGVKIKLDHHKGCLGTGDKEGRLVPTRVRGELEGREVVQVRVPVVDCGTKYMVRVTCHATWATGMWTCLAGRTSIASIMCNAWQEMRGSHHPEFEKAFLTD